MSGYVTVEHCVLGVVTEYTIAPVVSGYEQQDILSGDAATEHCV